ncbi:MAG: hypothetical protein M3P08_19540 [Thermoproteota archaeon]|nr:hypothetical protein [Thermoproteota archaeon]
MTIIQLYITTITNDLYKLNKRSDVSKIEYISLEVKKEKFNLNKMILNAIADFSNQIVRDNNDK